MDKTKIVIKKDKKYSFKEMSNIVDILGGVNTIQEFEVKEVDKSI